MSIPITCSGCKAAFDVPDNLAGKTIRCTSCKAQMSVPEDLPVEDVVEVEAIEEPVAAKKPFGAAPKAPAPKAPPKPVPAPEAKSNPAKPAAKPAAKAADEGAKKPQKKDDRDEKSKPAAGPKKAGITGSTRKRRDDDDDDDDDDTPRKKKKKPQGGSGGMIGIVVGGVVALALVAGLGIYFASGSSDKNDSASNSTGGGSNATPVANGGGGLPSAPGPIPGPGGPGRTPGAGSPSAVPSESLPGGGTPVVVTPGTATPDPITPGVGTPTPLPGPTPGGMNPVPGAPNGNPFAGLGKIDNLGTPGAWASYTGDGFTAEFPGTPETKTETASNGPSAKIVGVGGRDTSVALAMHIQFPAQTAANTQVLLNLMVNGLRQQTEFRNKTPIDATVDGNPAKEYDLKDSSGEGRMRLTAVKDRVYMFIAGGPNKNGKPSMSRADVDRFFNSIKITYKGDLVAGGPGAIPGSPPIGTPGGIGLPPMPPGGVGTPPMPPVGTEPPGGIGQPPIGIGQPPGGIGNPTAGSGDGNKKAKIENFYAGAFDAEKKELYTIDERPVPGDFRIKKGMLRRYSYENLAKEPNRYLLPQMASRAVIDPKAELLYVAAVNNPLSKDARGNLLNTDLNLLDNSSGFGDIVIYDLKLIRSGKTADGKDLKDGTELKPAATVSIKAMIHAIELSDDGKALYVLLTSATTGKKVSSLSIIHTETRKESRTALPTPMRGMEKAGDGKSLIVFEDFAQSRTGSTKVGTFDFASKSLVNVVSIQGGVWDLAPLKSGGALVTVQVPNQPNQPGGVNPGGIGGPGIGGPPGIIGGPPGGIGGPGIGGPGMGGPPGGAGGGGQAENRLNFRLHLINEKGGTEIDLGPAQRFSNAGYAEFDPENKKLYVSSCRSAGLDVFEVTDLSAANGLKLTTTIQTAGRDQVRGHCLVSPDGKLLVFHTGIVIDTGNVGGAPPGAPGGIAPPGGGIAPPGGIGQPGGGVIPGGMGTPPGMGVPPGTMPPPVVLTPGTGTPPGVTPLPGGGGMTVPGGMGSPPGTGIPGGMGSPPGGMSKPNQGSPAGGRPPAGGTATPDK